MTVTTSTAKSGPYAGAGTTGPFTVGFRFLQDSHLQVIRTSSLGVETVLTLTTDYTVTGAGAATGSVTLVAPLAVGQTLIIIRNVPFTQDADYVQNDAFPAESHETALDKLTMIVQQQQEELSRAVKTSVSDTITPDQLLDQIDQAALDTAADAAAAAASKTAAANSATVANVAASSAASSASSASTSATNAANAVSAAIGVTVQGYDVDTAKTDVAQTFTAAQRGAVTTLTDGATITPNFATANNFSVTLGGNRTLANPSNPVAGQSGVIKISQDATGSRTLAFGANWKFPGGTAPSLTTTASAVDILVYYVDNATNITAKLLGDRK